MRYPTREMGVVDVAPDQILYFAGPILGFESCRKYALLPVPQARPFFWLQSLEEARLAFPVVNTAELDMTYGLAEQDLRKVEASTLDEVSCWNIVSFPSDGEPIRINLRAPVVVNTRKHLAAQMILSDEYPVSIALNACGAAGNRPSRERAEAGALVGGAPR